MPADLHAEDIHVDLMVPALQQFDATAHGSVRVHADLAGAWPRPQIDADVHGDNLAFAGRTLEKLQATVHDAGGEGGAFQAHVLATTLRLSDSAAVVQALDATLDGRVSDHTLSLRITTAAGATLDAQAQGGVTGLPATARAGARAPAFELSALGWHGRLLKLDADAPEPVHLSSPAPFAVDASGWSFGPAAFDLAGGRAEDIEATLRDDTIKTRGTFHGLHPLHARALVTNSPAAGTSPPASVTTPPAAGAVPGAPQTLALDGSWHLQLGPEADRADGEISIARSGGDVSAGAPGHRVALGLTDLHLDLKLERGRFDVDGAMLGQRVGHARVKGHGVVIRGAGPLAWQLAPAQPFALSLDADLPAIEDVAPFAGDALQGIRLGGRITAAVQVDGTPADPHARGRIDGKDLRVVWIDQDVRLENGTLAATVADATVTLGELRFSGTQRTRPFDGRAAAHLKTTEVGFVTASGSFDVRSREGSIRFHAEHLPLLQRPDRWVVASGDGEFTASRDQVLLHGTVTADGGAIDFSRAELPSLSPDVTVRTSDADAANAPTRMAVGLDLSLDFGPAFYLRGRGLDTRAEGTLRLRSDGGGLLRGNGSLSAQDGKFEGFGQNLTIQRGRLDFQGPIDNPGLDILALRDGLPVTVGVTITGTAAQPQVRVYSDPPLPDYEALSWLVLGRPPEQGGNDSLAIASAAAGLLGGTGPGLPSRLAHQIGIDQVSVRSGELADTNSLLPAQSVAGPLRGDQTTPTTTQIVSVSKRIGNALTISYEQVASGAASVVQVSYQLSRRLSLLARAGTDNALDLVYTLSFD
jgi:translocation and assembly module TamB